jgi:hypothetical protein
MISKLSCVLPTGAKYASLLGVALRLYIPDISASPHNQTASGIFAHVSPKPNRWKAQ